MTKENNVLSVDYSLINVMNHNIYNPLDYCSQPCRNGGVCVGPHICKCAFGWIGKECMTGNVKCA